MEDLHTTEDSQIDGAKSLVTLSLCRVEIGPGSQ